MQKGTPFFFFCLFTALFLAIFYNTVTNMAGLYIVSELGGSSEISVYPMVFFSLGNTLTIPLASPLADRCGPIKLLVYSLLVYTLFSILCAVAPTFFVFNLFRFGMGLASGPLFILCRQLLLIFASPEKVKSYSFLMLLFYAIVPVLGACFGAWLAYEAHWRWIFHVNELVALFLAGYFWHFFRQSDAPLQQRRLDWVGILLLFIGVGALVTAATLSQQLDWCRSNTLIALMLVGIPSLFLFIAWEWTHPAPLLELKLLKSPLLVYSLFNLGILFSTYYGMIILIALWLNIYVNYTPTWIAALIGTMAIAGVLAHLISKDLLRRFDPRLTLALAILSFAGSCYYSTYFNVEVDFFHLAVARLLSGLGLILFLFPLSQLSFASYGENKASSVFTLFQVTRTLFSGLGAAFYVILWQRRQVFFHERLGGLLTPFSEATNDYFQRATQVFGLTESQAKEQLNVLLDQHATSLGLNDTFGYMGYILIGLFALLLLSYVWIRRGQCSPTPS